MGPETGYLHHDLLLRDPASRTLELETTGDGVFLRSLFEGIYRDRDHPLPAGF